MMIYFFATLFSLILPLFCYYFYKSYQLCGYAIDKYFYSLLSLPFGKKNKLVLTKRMWRAIICHFAICTTLLFVIFVYVKLAWLVALDVLIVYLFSPILLILAHVILWPFEIAIKKYYIKKAKAKLLTKKAKVIAITGSYGKTSTKNILAQMLEKNFKVCKTPQNFNTEMGLTKTILDYLDDEDFLIAEMGARHKGDIKKLCDISSPDISIVTTIGPQHLQTFGSLEAIQQTKSEIINFSKKDCTVFVNCDSKISNRIFNECNKNKFACNRFSAYAFATDVHFDKSGTRFVLNIENERFGVKTELLGRHNVDNIVTAAAVAYFLGISKSDIVSAIKHLKQTPHRLELIKNQSICVLDDAYNSNPIGAQEALNVLSTFDGKKIVVTPGFVEMGKEGGNANFKFGTQIADVADCVIIMNEENKNFIFSGLISHNFNRNNIFFATTREQQQKILKSLICQNAVILFENDLPDNFR